MDKTEWLQRTSPAFRLMIATSWLAPDSWRNNQDAAIREAIGAGPDWTEYRCLVDRHRTPAISWAALIRIPGIEIPEAAKRELLKRNDASRVQAIRQCRELVKILKAFNGAGIPVMALKGPILASEIYGDVGLRQSSDLDLVVKSDDIVRAQGCLTDLGWRLDSTFLSMTPRQWDKFQRMEDDLSFIHAREDYELELHSRIHRDSPDHNSARWARSMPSVWQGCSHQAMNSIDQVLYLCSHGGDHAWFRAKWLGDLARIQAAGRVNWEAALALAQSTSQEKPLLSCLRLLQIVYKLPSPRFQGDPCENLPPFFINIPLHALKVLNEPKARSVLEFLPDLIYSIRYPRQVLPQKKWGESISELFYCRQDYRMIRLPDSLFWAYAPLRPILFAWRKVTQAWTRLRGRVLSLN